MGPGHTGAAAALGSVALGVLRALGRSRADFDGGKGWWGRGWGEGVVRRAGVVGKKDDTRTEDFSLENSWMRGIFFNYKISF